MSKNRVPADPQRPLTRQEPLVPRTVKIRLPPAADNQQTQAAQEYHDKMLAASRRVNEAESWGGGWRAPADGLALQHAEALAAESGQKVAVSVGLHYVIYG